MYETQLVRHTTMIVGPTGGGKTLVLETLKNARLTAENIVVRIIFIYKCVCVCMLSYAYIYYCEYKDMFIHIYIYIYKYVHVFIYIIAYDVSG
jgi:hypothetical protein